MDNNQQRKIDMDNDWQQDIDDMKKNLSNYRDKFWQLFLYWTDAKCPKQALGCFNLSDLLDMVHESLVELEKPSGEIEDYEKYKYGEYKHALVGFTRGSVGLLDGFNNFIQGSTLDDDLKEH